MKTVARLFIFIFLSTIFVEARAGNPNPGVLPPKSTPFGKTYGVWAGEFNNWVWHFPAAESPFFAGNDGSKCGQGQKGKVWFLAGTLDPFGTVVRDGCIIPAGKALFFSIYSTVSFVPFFGNNEEEVRADAARDVALNTTISVVVDGVPLNNLSTYRASSPVGGFVLSAPEGSLLADFVGAGDYDPAVADGYWIMLAPLSIGAHIIQISASGSFQDGSEYSYDVTYNLTVVNKKEQ